MNHIEVYRFNESELIHPLDGFIAQGLGNNLHTIEQGLQAMCQGLEFSQGFYLPSGDGWRLEIDDVDNLLLNRQHIAYGGQASSETWAGVIVLWHEQMPEDKLHLWTKVPGWYPVLREYLSWRGWRQHGVEEGMVDAGPDPDIWIPPASTCEACSKFVACTLAGVC